ncbi:MAG: Spy/CpxP family protein refolding chaperone [candidate division Zixibacteria bacterium]|nr:Spy/CpxP family protein refolding chaperone [candidate division Zixibacteria bacterium]
MNRYLLKATLVLGTAVALAGGREAAAQMEWESIMEDPLVGEFEVMMDPIDEEIVIFEEMPMSQDGAMGARRTAQRTTLAEKLALTDDQKQKMETLRTALAKEMARLRADVEVATIELREIMDQSAPKAADAQIRAARVSQARAKIFERAVAFRLDMKSVLRPEQQKIMKETREMRRGPMMRGMRMGPGMRGGMGPMGPAMRGPMGPGVERQFRFERRPEPKQTPSERR